RARLAVALDTPARAATSAIVVIIPPGRAIESVSGIGCRGEPVPHDTIWERSHESHHVSTTVVRMLSRGVVWGSPGQVGCPGIGSSTAADIAARGDPGSTRRGENTWLCHSDTACLLPSPWSVWLQSP